MDPSLRILLEAVTAAGTLGCLIFYAISLMGLVSFLKDPRGARARVPPESQSPPVSILKPLKGVDPEIWENFRSHAEQRYPEFELIFGVSDPADPACETVRKLQAKYPARTIKLVICDRILGANVKVSNLVQMLDEARHEVLLINDSDIRVPADYLDQVVSPLANPEIGLVTCLYRGAPASTLGSRIEAVGISTDFAPGVLSARLLEKGLHFGLGSTLVLRRDDLASIGGFASLLDYLADDYELGRRLAATGKRVELSAATVQTFLPAYTLTQFWRHQLRWSRTIRDARRWGYVGLLFTFGFPWSLATLMVSSGADWAWALFGLTACVRLLMGLATSITALHDTNVLRNTVLMPVRDLIAPLIWAAGLIGDRIQWRGEDFKLSAGKLTRISEKA
jgi:ceramide glucosyltransferase